MKLAGYADMLLSMQRFDEALDLVNKTLEWRIEQHGEGHTTVIDAYIQIAEIYFDMSDYEQAESNAVKANELTADNPNLIWSKIQYPYNDPQGPT